MRQEVNKMKRQHRQVSIPLLQAKLKMTHDQAKKLVEASKSKAKKRQNENKTR